MGSLELKLCDRLKLPPQTIHSSGLRCHLTSSFRDLRLFLELAPWPLLTFHLLFHLSRGEPFLRTRFLRALSPFSLLAPSSPPPSPSSATSSVDPRARCTARSVLTLSPWRHVRAIFCAADGSCRDQPTNASNIPARIAFHHLAAAAAAAAASSRNGIPSGLMFFSSAAAGRDLVVFNRVNTPNRFYLRARAPFRELNARIPHHLLLSA